MTACPAEEVVKLASLPAWSGSSWFIGEIDDLLLYRVFDGGNSDGAVLDPCTGEVAPEAIADANDLAVATTPRGRLLYGASPGGEVFILDDLDAPGFDEPRPVDGLTQIGEVVAIPGGVLLCTPRAPDVLLPPRACWVHDGDASHPPRAVGDAVTYWSVSPDAVFLLDASGTLRSGDATSGDTEQLAADVRRMWLAPEGRHLVWETGDDASTRIVARDLQAGTQRVLLQDHEPDAGRWIFNGDGTAAGLVDDDDHFEALFRLDTGAALPLPEHTAVTPYSHGPEFELQLSSEPGLHIRAYWNPFLPDAPRVWFDDAQWTGGPTPRRDGDVILYSLNDICAPTRSVYRVDLRVGEHQLIAQYVAGRLVPLADGRFLTSTSHDWDTVADLVVIDPDTGSVRVIAEAVDAWIHVEERGVFYVRATGDDAGVWAAPLPARS